MARMAALAPARHAWHCVAPATVLNPGLPASDAVGRVPSTVLFSAADRCSFVEPNEGHRFVYGLPL